MKKFLSCVVVVLFALSALCETWTFHAAKDNWSSIIFYGQDAASGHYFEWGNYWDWTFDQIYPEWADSGSWSRDHDTNEWFASDGIWREVWVFNNANNAELLTLEVGGPANDYSGLVHINRPSLTAGEYWIDFASDGTVRVSTIQPADFGKWAWDGSINPSWIEPLAGKRLAKGHKK